MKRALAIAALLLTPLWAAAAVQLGTIHGSVLDSSGRPVAGALVSVAAGPSTLDRMVFTDSRGIFEFENLANGEYAVQVRMVRFAPSTKERVQVVAGANAVLRFNLLTLVEDIRRRGASPDVRGAQDIVWTLRSSRGTQSVLRYVDNGITPMFRKLVPDYSGYLELYSKADPGARTISNTMGSRFSVTLGMPADAKVTFTGQYNESPLDPKGASALYEFNPADGHEAQIAVNARQGILLDDAFSAEELKELQLQFRDKFHLTNSLMIDQGAQVGHAEGRNINNYVRPRLAVSWLPAEGTILTAAVNMQAPGNTDDPVRGREYFEQVNLPPAYEHYLHSEVSGTQFLDASTKVSVSVFEDRSNFRALFVKAADGRRGLLVFDGKANPSRGMSFGLSREFKGFEAGLGYTTARGMGFGADMTSLADVRQSVASRPFQSVTAQIKTTFDLTDTELTAVYRWVSRYAVGPIDPYQQSFEFNDPTLSISVAQELPTFGTIPAKVQAIFDARNLLEPAVGPANAQLVHSARYVKGGINIRF